MLTRRTISDAFGARLPAHDFIRAGWLGGSDATGRADDLSDVDLGLIVLPGRIEDAAEAVESVLASLSPIRLKIRLPMPTWHGFHQAFYQLADAPEHLMVDWVFMEQGQPHPWFETDRHGTPIVLFDKDGDIKLARSDLPALQSAAKKKIEDTRAKFAMFRHLPVKLAQRGLPADAAYFYHALVLRPLVDVLRAVHCPQRHDYGFRYLKDDLPRELYEKVCRLCYPASEAAIESCMKEASQLIDAACGRS